MTIIVTRSSKGTPLTHTEMDANFSNLNTDKAEKTDLASILVNQGASLIGINDTESKFSSTTVEGALQETRTELELSASSGSSLIGFIQNGTGAVSRTVQSKGRERVSVFDFAVVGDGVADDTVALQACYTAHAGKEIDHGNGFTFLVSAALNLASSTTYKGRSKIKAKDAAGISSAVMLATAKTRIVIDGIEIDANTDAGGSTGYGLFFDTGSFNTAKNMRISNTKNAGIRIEAEDGTEILDNIIESCGRTGVTDNHGIMIGSIQATPCKNWLIHGNTISNSFRKGITTYGFAPGIVKDGIISDNIVKNGGLGGIYVSGDIPTVTNGLNITIANNIAIDNYANYEISNCTGVSCSNNSSSYTNPTAKFAGWAIAGGRDISITGGTNDNAPVHGVVISASGAIPSARIQIKGMVITDPNQTTAGTGTGVQITDATFCHIDCDISDSTAKMTHGVLEGSGGDNNDIFGSVRDGTAARIVIAGTNTRIVNRSGRNTSFGTQTPQNTVDINGGITIRGNTITLNAGLNSNVVLPTNGLVVIQGPAGAYSIGGFAGGHDGRRITLNNFTVQTLTLNHQDAGSSAGNKLTLSGSANRTVPSFASVELIFSSQVGAWIAIN